MTRIIASKGRWTTFADSRSLTVYLLASPWVAWIIYIAAAISIGLKDRSKVFRAVLYCESLSPRVGSLGILLDPFAHTPSPSSRFYRLLTMDPWLMGPRSSLVSSASNPQVPQPTRPTRSKTLPSFFSAAVINVISILLEVTIAIILCRQFFTLRSFRKAGAVSTGVTSSRSFTLGGASLPLIFRLGVFGLCIILALM